MPQASKIPDAKGSVEREWDKLENIPAWQLTKVRNKKEVIDEARNEGQKSSVCVIDGSLSSPEFGVNKGRVVPRGDIVKEDSRSSASQMTAAKVMDII